MSSAQIVNNLPALIGYWDRNLRNRFANHAYIEWFGVTPEGICGKHLKDVIGEERFQLNSPYIEGVLAGVPQTFERMIPSPDGKLIRHSLANYIPDVQSGVVVGFFVLVTDVTQIISLHAALKASEQRYRAIVDDQTEVICRFTPDGRLLFVNEVYCRVFGKREKDFLGNKWEPVCHPEDISLVQEKLRALNADNPVVLIENRVWVADGSLRWMQFVNRGFFEKQALIEIQSVGRDITERKQAELALQTHIEEQEEKIRQRTVDLHRMTVDAVLAEAREREAIARDLHDDIGQLLHVAKLRLEAIGRKNRSQETMKEIQALDELIRIASQRVRSLTAQLSPPVLESLGLVPALNWLVEEIARVYGLQVRFSDDGLEKTLAYGKEVILFRAARELLINVVKHAQSPDACLFTRREGNEFILIVEDRGVGILANNTAVLESTGFGLRSLMERVAYLGGRLEMKRGAVGGTSVTICVPFTIRHE